MRPSGATAVASVNTKPTRPRANAVRCEKWKALATPSRAMYMHSGERTMRFGSVTDLIVIGEKRRDEVIATSVDFVTESSRSVSRGWGTGCDGEPYRYDIAEPRAPGCAGRDVRRPVRTCRLDMDGSRP